MLNLIATAARTIARRARNHVRRALAPQIVAHRNGPIITDAIATGELVTITRHLTALGADPEFARRYGSPAGVKVAKAYRARTGRDPLQVWTVAANGYPIQVKAYLVTDPALSAGLSGYQRTAHLVAA